MNTMLYGAIGLNVSYFYDLHVAAGITSQGRSSISNAILLFESFLNNNVFFESLDDILGFIDNVLQEHRKYDDKDIIEYNVSTTDCFRKLVMSCGFNGYIPSDNDMNVIYNILGQLSQESLNRLYYKNNLYAFCENSSVQRAIMYILEKLETPFLDPNDVEKKNPEIRVELNELLELFKEYVYYGHMYVDKIDRCATMFKSVSILTDTDSSVINLDGWYRYVLSKTYNKKFKIKNEYLDEKKYVEENKKEVVEVDEDLLEDEYNFFTDEFTQMRRTVNKDKIIPQDSLRHSIINIMVYVLSQLSTDYMQRYSASYNSYGDSRCYLTLKNEFFWKRTILMLEAKKHYSSYTEFKEGKPVPPEKATSVTGMELDKSSLKDVVRSRLKKILTDDILLADEIDQKKILVDIIKFEKDIYNSLASGEDTYYTPKSIRSIESYDMPLRQAGIKAALIYNDTRDEGSPAIDLKERNKINLVKLKVDPINAEKLRDTYPRVYEALQKYFKMDEFKNGITAIAVPHGVQIPKWAIDYIDYYNIINANIKSFPFESVGLVGRAGNDSVNHSNILQIV